MFQKDQKAAFNPLGKDGLPIRKFSERHDHQLFMNPRHGPDTVGVTYVEALY